LEERGSIIVMLNFDALGSGDVVGVLGDGDLAQSVMTYGQEEGIAVERRFTLGGSSSDHASFLDAGIPAVFFLADDFSRIHTAEDRLQFVQPELMGNSAALALGLLDILARR
ncbi:MAG: M28 family peptidase, partial [SAR202 cluster bacterium]|nr:M28 family peptidase [SAR202 cluster bacterium]